MELLSDKIADVISKELPNNFEQQKLQEFGKFISEMEKSGLIKKPAYDLPLVDTIGKNYYSSINKHK